MRLPLGHGVGLEGGLLFRPRAEARRDCDPAPDFNPPLVGCTRDLITEGALLVARAGASWAPPLQIPLALSAAALLTWQDGVRTTRQWGLAVGASLAVRTPWPGLDVQIAVDDHLVFWDGSSRWTVPEGAYIIEFESQSSHLLVLRAGASFRR